MPAIRSTPPSRAAAARCWPSRRLATFPHRARQLANTSGEEIMSSRLSSRGKFPINRQIERVLRQ